MTTKHTPGPWSVEGVDKNGQAVVGGEFIEVCTCWHHSVGLIEQEMWANARLIAAAPELLEALKDIVSMWDEYAHDDPPLPAHVIARAAVAKAEGHEP